MGTEGVGSGCARVTYPRRVAMVDNVIGLVDAGRRVVHDVMLMRCMLRSKHFDAIFFYFNVCNE